MTASLTVEDIAHLDDPDVTCQGCEKLPAVFWIPGHGCGGSMVCKPCLDKLLAAIDQVHTASNQWLTCNPCGRAFRPPFTVQEYAGQVRAL